MPSRLRCSQVPCFCTVSAGLILVVPQQLCDWTPANESNRFFLRFFDHGRNGTGIYCVVRRSPHSPSKEALMKIALTKPLFAWDALEDSPALTTLRSVLAAVPDH